METNFFTGKFKKNNLRVPNIRKVYFQRKIKTEEYPSLQKNLKTFFNDYSKYFDTSFEENHIIVGKKYNSNHKSNLLMSSNDEVNTKFKGKRYAKRPTLKKNFWSKKSDSINRSKFDDKRASFEDKENNLKPNQRFIDDKEIDKLFNLFRELRKINKNRSHNFMNLKELKEAKEELRKKTFKINSNLNNNLFNSINIEEKKYGTLILRNNNNMELNSDSEYNKTLSTNIGGYMQDEHSKNNIKNYEYNEKTIQSPMCKTGILRQRKELIQNQKQYLYKNIQLSLKNQFAETLAAQENVFLNQSKSYKYQKHFSKNIRSHIKKNKNFKLLLLDDTHRENVEFKKKIDFYQNKLNPDKLYDWYYDLHLPSSESRFPFLEKKIENIRNPENMKALSKFRNRTLEKDQYLKNIFPMNYLKNLDKDLNNINNNYEHLCIKGKNLLQLENDMAKKLKGRKIINDFEKMLSPAETKEENIYSNIGNNIN